MTWCCYDKKNLCAVNVKWHLNILNEWLTKGFWKDAHLYPINELYQCRPQIRELCQPSCQKSSWILSELNLLKTIEHFVCYLTWNEAWSGIIWLSAYVLDIIYVWLSYQKKLLMAHKIQEKDFYASTRAKTKARVLYGVSNSSPGSKITQLVLTAWRQHDKLNTLFNVMSKL